MPVTPRPRPRRPRRRPATAGPKLGAHMSIAGGYWRAVEAAARAGCECVQLFTRNNAQWRAKPITDAEADEFNRWIEHFGISHPLSHASYLINLATPDEALRCKSVDAMVMELQRAAQLGIPFVVVHPGAFTTATLEVGIANAIRSLNELNQRTVGLGTSCLLENTAGAGSCLGGDFAELASILNGIDQPATVGVCFDTCHAFAAGYPLAPRPAYLRTMRELDRAVGLQRIKAIHLNDSRGGLGSHLDRHQHIGRGQIGLEGFGHLLNDPRFRQTPMYLETPKGMRGKQDWDRINLRTLRKLL